jgi:hypothetical protein
MQLMVAGEVQTATRARSPTYHYFFLHAAFERSAATVKKAVALFLLSHP